ncbi:YceI family protein [Winogradskyella undariae]|uniref:YceI family protein n=1 Tax=Winogradskyella undariae TaxID=1285465 RepID=UPI00156ADAFD|nr:YceI family protein [Winogradskyella undariae]NRR90611.1 YceI family protein [Winogradskyella undariae]
MIRTFLFLFLFLLGPVKQSVSETKVLDSKESVVFFSSDSYLKIKGKTNVSTFECNFDMTAISEAIKISYKDYDKKIKFDDTKLILPNLEFNCGGKMINKDFNELLNTEEFPEITLKLKEISKVKINDNSITVTIEIKISDIIKTYKIPVSITENSNLHVNGVMPLDINDFNLTAPTKMLGMVKVSPQIEIQFSLKILES